MGHDFQVCELGDVELDALPGLENLIVNLAYFLILAVIFSLGVVEQLDLDSVGQLLVQRPLVIHTGRNGGGVGEDINRVANPELD